MRIKKVSQTVPTTAQVVDGYSNSATDSPSCNDAINHNVVVSATEPTTDRRKVWLQYSNNLWSAGDVNVNQNESAMASISVSANTNYTLSFQKSRISGATITNQDVFTFNNIKFYNSSNTLLSTIDSQSSDVYNLPTGTILDCETSFTTPANTSYIKVNFNNRNGDANTNTLVSNIMLNEGSTALPYEQYTQRKIFILINNEYKIFM